MRIIKFSMKVLISILVFVSFFVVSTSNVFALDETSIKSKAALEGLQHCMSTTVGAYYKSFSVEKNLESAFVVKDGPEDAVKLPYGMTSAGDNTTNCREAMFGWTDIGSDKLYKGFIPDNIQNSNSSKTVAQFFAGNKLDGDGGTGYKAIEVGVSNSDGQKLVYKIDSDQSPCGGEEPKIVSVGSIQFPDGIDSITFPTISKNSTGTSLIWNTEESFNVPEPGSNNFFTYNTNCGVTITVTDKSEKDKKNNLDIKYSITVSNYSISSEDLTEYTKKISTSITDSGAQWTAKGISGDGPNKKKITLTYDTLTIPGGSYGGGYTLTYSNNRDKFLVGFNTKNTIGYKVNNLSTYDDLKLTRQEVYDLYKHYITDSNILTGMASHIVCEGDENYDVYADSPTINWKGKTTCRVRNRTDIRIPDNLYGVFSNFHFGKKIESVEDVIAGLGLLGEDLCDLKGVEGCGDSPNNPDTPGSTSDFDCDQLIDENTNGEGIGAMQWVLCPSLNNTAYTADWLDTLTQNLLEVNSDMYGYDGLRDVWSSIRNVANVIIIVFLLAVIISQLTGYGIDNYGIKKMLPRIIMMAIIINLSFYICQLAIDLSNIAGVGLRNMFGTLAGSTTNDSSYVITALMGVFSAAPTVGGAVISGLAFGGWVAVVIGLVVLVIVIVVALITFFAMLGIRDVIIIFCIIISPLAFAAFILPNTQHLFKKWWELFKAAIIVFPLCGAASGISASMRKMAEDGSLGDLGLGSRLIMLVLPYLVFFLLPMLLKQAIAGLGKLGGALTSMGQTIKSGGKSIGQNAAKGAQRTQRAQDLAKRAAWRAERRRNAHLLGVTDKNGLQRAKDAREAAENAKGFAKWRLNRRADRLADDARLRYEGVQGDNKFKMEASTATEGGVEIAWDMAESRAKSAKETLEVKLHVDRNATLMRGELNDEIQKAAKDFEEAQGKGKEEEEKAYYRLKAAITSGMSRDMNKEMFAKDGSLAKLELSNTGFSGKIADLMAGGNNKVMSQFGKTLFKRNDGKTVSLNDFIGDQGEYGMTQAFATKGDDYAIGIDEDTLHAIKEGGGKLTTKQVIKGAGATTNEKILREFREMLSGKEVDSDGNITSTPSKVATRRTSSNSNKYQVGYSDLTSLDTKTLRSVDISLLHDAAKEIWETKDTDATRELLDKMDQDTRNEVLKLGSSLASGPSPTPGPTPSPTHGPSPTPGPTPSPTHGPTHGPTA